MREGTPRTTGAHKVEDKRDIRAELDRLENQIGDLKTQFEQYFTGVVQLPPDRLHNDVKRALRALMKAPFKNAAMNYRLRALENRYRTFHTYWQRVMKQREDGTYSKDVFKATLREKQALEEVRSQTSAGAAEKNLQQLFNSYRAALEKQTGKKQNIDFDAFHKSLLQRAKDFREKFGAEKVSFRVAVKNGKVTVQLRAKKDSPQEQAGPING